MLTDRPHPDQFEFSLFGPGVGECSAIHLGYDEWMIVDSFIDKATKSPIAKVYLDSIGVGLENIKVILVTHWHDDHIKGISDIIQQSPYAIVCVTSAIYSPAILSALAPWIQSSDIHALRCLSELVKIRNLADFQPILAGDGTMLYRSQQIDTEVISLSPSGTDVLSSAHHLAQASGGKYAQRLPSIGPNETSVVASIKSGSIRLLLGGDLPVGGNPGSGWQAALNSFQRLNQQRHHAYKVAHHGSSNSDLDQIWNDLLIAHPYAALTPFRACKNSPPTDSDIARLNSRNATVFLTSSAASARFTHPNPAVQRTMLDNTKSIQSLRGRPGQVRFRAPVHAPFSEWQVALSGDAKKL
jgi:beta-lactamase superfamily II metal-dependent hydrolase